MLSLYLLIRESFVLSFPDGTEVKRLLLGREKSREHITLTTDGKKSISGRKRERNKEETER